MIPIVSGSAVATNLTNNQSISSEQGPTSIRRAPKPFNILTTSFPPLRNLLLPFLEHQRHRVHTQSAPSVSSAPVVVTTYSGPRVLTMARSSTNPAPPLPPVSAFAFSHVLLAIDDQIQPAISGLSVICARSRLSLASEHAAHLPPQGEIGVSNPEALIPPPPSLGRTRSLWVRTTGLGTEGWDRGTALSVVLEAENSSGSRSSASASASEAGTLRSALGSLREVLNKGGSPTGNNYKGKGKDRADDFDETPVTEKSGWAVKRIDEGGGADKDGIVVVGSPTAKVAICTTNAAETDQAGNRVEARMGGSGWLGWSRGVGLGKQATVESTLRGILETSTRIPP